MKRRSLGNSGLEVAPLAFGGNVFGWTADERTSFQLLDAFVAAGCNFIDTADVYSKFAPGNQGGESETILGRWLKQSGKRHKSSLPPRSAWNGAGQKGLAKTYILRAVEDSLRRLQIDCIDLYQAHVDDPANPLRNPRRLRAADQARKSPRHRRVELQRRRLTQALTKQTPRPARMSASRYTTFVIARVRETELEPVCLAHGLGVISYFSLAKGFLTGKYRPQPTSRKAFAARASRHT